MADDRKANESIRVQAHATIALLQFAAGDAAGYDKTLQQMLTTFEASDRARTQATLAFVGGASKSHRAWKPSESAERLEAALPNLKQPMPAAWRGLALARLRAGQPGRVDEAIAKIGEPSRPIDFVILRMAAAARGEVAKARDRIAQAEDAVSQLTPSEAKPNTNVDERWRLRIAERLHFDELKAAVGRQ